MNAFKILIILIIVLLVGVKTFGEYLIEINWETLSVATTIISLAGFAVIIVFIVFCLLLWMADDEHNNKD